MDGQDEAVRELGNSTGSGGGLAQGDLRARKSPWRM
jgi:hypothetical protein